MKGNYEYLCPVCDKDYMNFFEKAKEGGAIISFVEKKNVPEHVFKKYTIVVYADNHPEIFKRENLYLSFR